METYLSKQAIAFLWAVVLGFGLGGYYDIFRIIRILRPKDRPTLVFIEDLLFALGAAFSTAFCLTLTNYGQVRAFLLVGEGLGFMIWRQTLGVLVAKIARFTARLLRILGRFLRKILVFLKKPFLFLKRCAIMYMYRLKERRKSHEAQNRRKGKAHRKDESRRSRPFDRWRRLCRHHHDRSQREESGALL
jgi:spore cortex biosynthesis protein YabQ